MEQRSGDRLRGKPCASITAGVRRKPCGLWNRQAHLAEQQPSPRSDWTTAAKTMSTESSIIQR
jgi:hypothetical protein